MSPTSGGREFRSRGWWGWWWSECWTGCVYVKGFSQVRRGEVLEGFCRWCSVGLGTSEAGVMRWLEGVLVISRARREVTRVWTWMVQAGVREGQSVKDDTQIPDVTRGGKQRGSWWRGNCQLFRGWVFWTNEENISCVTIGWDVNVFEIGGDENGHERVCCH